jgi:hypothetical protein
MVGYSLTSAVLRLDRFIQQPYDRLMWSLERRLSPPQILRDAKSFEILMLTIMTATIPFFGSTYLAVFVFLAFVLSLPGHLVNWRLRSHDAKAAYGPALANRYARAAITNREGKPFSRISLVVFGSCLVLFLLVVLLVRSTIDASILLKATTAVLSLVALISGMYLESAIPSPPSGLKTIETPEL